MGRVRGSKLCGQSAITWKVLSCVASVIYPKVSSDVRASCLLPSNQAE